LSRKGRGKIAQTIPLLEEIFSSAQSLGLSAWSSYYIPTLPFVLGLLYFWFDMANHAYAYERLPLAAGILSVLFLLMKTGHVYFTTKVSEQISGNLEEEQPRLAGVVANQSIFQVVGILLLPLSLLFVVPFGGLYALFQNASVLDNGNKPLKELFVESKEQAVLNPTQNHVMLWLICPYAVGVAVSFYLILVPIMQAVSPVWTDFYVAAYSIIVLVLVVPLCPFGVIVAINLGAALLLIPYLLKTLMGIDTIFTVNPSIASTPSFFVAVSGLTYLCLDPLIKIGYSIRCFQGAAIHSGQDLKVNLHRLKKGTATVLAVFFVAAALLWSAPAFAQTTEAVPSIHVEQLDQAIDVTLQNRKFAWRTPRVRPEMADTGLFGSITLMLRDAAKWIVETIRDIMDWLEGLMPTGDRGGGQPGAMSGSTARDIAIVVLVVLLCVMGYVGFLAWRNSNVVEVVAAPVQPVVPDLRDENTTADELPSNEWLRLANEFMENGDTRLAMRAYFFAGLAHLDYRKFIRLAAHKSNREYRRELLRIAHAKEGLMESYSGNLRAFESVWYGDHKLNEAELNSYIEKQKWLSQDV